MTLEQPARVLTTFQEAPAAIESGHGFIAREHVIVRSVARGESNKEIARTLSVAKSKGQGRRAKHPEEGRPHQPNSNGRP